MQTGNLCQWNSSDKIVLQDIFFHNILPHYYTKLAEKNQLHSWTFEVPKLFLLIFLPLLFEDMKKNPYISFYNDEFLKIHLEY